ncbi:MAG: hypothetical protein UT30_C0044G0002 [Candidatus Uhrbacteria bacterium GW2011_GWF2_39_13]|uniref:Uncharacterized protein n=1 Tax=Candidatus Uhrbacteria bacterium GW2011_GWF2_39_13 TaxID=1618995 RepID=A0A0G0MR57_9BACT|nr:MAG: hypothetical protein UT30_C0044G0002 [Candidatus Uhrbacteria bacterium GW2011_GWF2_39_13]
MKNIKNLNIILRISLVIISLIFIFGFSLPLLPQPYNFLIYYFDEKNEPYIVEKLYRHKFYLYRKYTAGQPYKFKSYKYEILKFANFYIKQGLYNDAIELYNEYKDYYKDSKIINIKIGTAYLLSKNYKKAESYLNRVILEEKNEYFPTHVSNLGLVKLNLGKYKEAEYLFNKTSTLFEKDPMALYLGSDINNLYNLTLLYEKMGENEKRKEYLQKTLNRIKKFSSNFSIDSKINNIYSSKEVLLKFAKVQINLSDKLNLKEDNIKNIIYSINLYDDPKFVCCYYELSNLYKNLNENLKSQEQLNKAESYSNKILYFQAKNDILTTINLDNYCDSFNYGIYYE